MASDRLDNTPPFPPSHLPTASAGPLGLMATITSLTRVPHPTSKTPSLVPGDRLIISSPQILPHDQKELGYMGWYWPRLHDLGS